MGLGSMVFVHLWIVRTLTPQRAAQVVVSISKLVPSFWLELFDLLDIRAVLCFGLYSVWEKDGTEPGHTQPCKITSVGFAVTIFICARLQFVA
jgi:hypothetical protein